MSRQLKMQKVEALTSASTLIDTSGFIQAHDESWHHCASLLNVPPMGNYVSASYPRLFLQWPEFFQSLTDLISKISLGKCRQAQLRSPNDSVEIHMSRLFGDSEQILVRHTERIEAGIESPSKLCPFEIIDNLPGGIAIVDAQGGLIHSNDALSKMFGECLAFILGHGSLLPGYTCFDQTHSPIGESPLNMLRHTRCDAKVKFILERPFRKKNWYEMDVKARVNMRSNRGRLFFSIHDITKTKAAEEQLIAAHNRLHLATDGADIGVWEWIPGAGELVWNEKMFQLFGTSSEGRKPSDLWSQSIHPEDRDRVEYNVKRCLRLKKDARIDFRVIWDDGTVRHLRSQTRVLDKDERGQLRLVGVNWDVTGEVCTERRLQSMAYSDALTGLANRTTLMFRLNRALVRAMQRQSRVAFFMMDLDNFKDINDNFGHLVGDELLRSLVDRLKHLVRSTDTFARLAGDEFALVVENLVELGDAESFAGRIQDALGEPFSIERGPAIQTSISIGISVFPDDGKDATTLLKAADLAMYSAKRSGGNTTRTYSPSMSAALNRKLALELMLREASRDESFELYYQPIVRLDTGQITGCEALIRWRDSNGSFVSPRDFIPVAENCGLIPKIGNWVLETAFKQWLLWKHLRHSLSYVSINVSPHQLHESGFSDDLINLAKRYGVNPKQIQLEITEGTFLLETKNADSHLQRLIDAGFRLAIDDFGTGYSSLAYLKRFNVDVIKIDRGFIVDIESNKADQEIVNAILSMTETLGFQVLIEGVEEFGQRNLISHMGCEFAQGFLFGRPTFSDEFAEIYLSHGCVNS